MTHTTHFGELALEQLDLLADRRACRPSRSSSATSATGVGLRNVLPIAERGAWLSVDNLGFIAGYAPLEVRADNVAALWAAGFGPRIVLGNDICRTDQLAANGGPGYANVLERFLPLLRARGLGEAEIRALYASTIPPAHSPTMPRRRVGTMARRPRRESSTGRNRMAKPRVLITGANGLIGSLTSAGLSDKYDFSGLSRHAVEGIPYTVGLVTRPRGAAARDRGPWTWSSTSPARRRTPTTGTTTSRSPRGGTINVLRAAAEAGVKRVVFMSTGSTMCGWEWDDSLPYGKLARGETGTGPTWELLDYRTPPRPDSPYGAAKLFGEAAARWFSDQTPMSVLVIRLGAVLPSNRARAHPPLPGLPGPGGRGPDDRSAA